MTWSNKIPPDEADGRRAVCLDAADRQFEGILHQDLWTNPHGESEGTIEVIERWVVEVGNDEWVMLDESVRWRYADDSTFP